MRSRLVDGAIALALAVSAGIAGTRYVHTVLDGGGRAEYYQNEFGPAVSVACGRGYVNPDVGALPALQDFLAGRTDRFDCAAMPASMRTVALTGPQLTWKYLLGLAALVWKISRTVSWRGLVPLSGLFFGITVAVVYLGLRLLAGRLLSTLGSMALMTSPMHLRELPHLRDYSKAPFMVAVGAILGVLVGRRLSLRATIAWSGLYGLVLGSGAGFRNDLLITIPAFAIAAVFCAYRSDGHRIGRMAGAASAAGVAFFVAAFPVLGAYGSGGGASMPHVALLGLTSPFDQALGVAPAPLYSFGPLYNDSYIAAMVSDYAARVQGRADPIRVYDRTYDAASQGVAASVVTTLPADLWVRALGSLTRIAELPASNYADVAPPPYLQTAWLQRMFDWRAAALRGLQTAIFATVLLAFALAAADAPAVAFMVFVIAAYFAAYPAIQFHERHYFHLNVIAIAAAVFVTARLGSALRALSPYAAAHPARRPARSVRNVAKFIAGAGLVLVAPLWPLRAYQATQVRTLLSRYEHAVVEPITLTERTLEARRVALDVVQLPASARSITQFGAARAEYLVAEFAPGACDAAGIEFLVRYDSTDSSTDFSRPLSAQPPIDGSQAVRVFFPVYYAAGANLGPGVARTYSFRGLELPAAQRPCLTALSRFTNLADFPLLLDASLPAGWETATMFQTLIGVEPSHSPVQLTIYPAPPGINVARNTLFAPLALLRDTEATAGSVTIRGPGSLVVRGRGGIGASGPFTYLVQFRAQHRRAGQRLIAEGELRRGGLSLGVLSRGQWMVQTSVVAPGRFLVVVELPRDAPDGQVVVANNLHGWSLNNDFEITRIGWQP